MGANETLNYEEFKEHVKNNIKEYLPPEYEDAKVKITQIQKNNGLLLDGLILETSNTNVFPTIYLNDFFKDYEKGMEMNAIMVNIKDVQLNHAIDTRMDISKITDIEMVRDRIVPRIVNMEANKDLLKDRPFTQMEDLAVTYHIQLEGCEDATATVAITDTILEKLGLKADELHDIAINNINEVTKPQFINMAEMLASTIIPGFDSMSPEEKREAMDEVLHPQPQVPMYIITNANKTHGASAVLDEKLMDEVRDQLGDFYILPSSIHELIVFPKDENTPPLEELEGLVQEVNRTQVAEYEVLSDHVYSYDANTKEIYRADKEEEHLKKVAEKDTKEKSAEKNEKKTLKSKLAEKKAEADKTNSERPKKEVNKSKSKQAAI